uniref:Uncharacterized protein n=1 Tax=Tetradesmus obliquus TaxID=3088 RepID=A0A383VXW4_TETOB
MSASSKCNDLVHEGRAPPRSSTAGGSSAHQHCPASQAVWKCLEGVETFCQQFDAAGCALHQATGASIHQQQRAARQPRLVTSCPCAFVAERKAGYMLQVRVSSASRPGRPQEAATP